MGVETKVKGGGELGDEGDGEEEEDMGRRGSGEMGGEEANMNDGWERCVIS